MPATPFHTTGDALSIVNGQPQSPGAASLSVRDRGLTLADGVFETMRVSRARVFQLDEHLARLQQGLVVLRIPPVGNLRAAVLDAVTRFGADEAAVRLTVTRGVGSAGLTPPAAPSPSVIITVSALPVFAATIYEQGLSAHVPRGRRNPQAATAGLKTLSYTDAIVGLLEAQDHGADEALFLDVDGHCSEASASNLFVCIGTTLVTPPVSCAALPGITRATIVQLASTVGCDAIERPLTVEDALRADEAFLTSSLRGIAPLVRIGTNVLGNGRPGDVTRRVSTAYAALLTHDTAG
jgi:branched-chain amino acid aminotransferase